MHSLEGEVPHLHVCRHMGRGPRAREWVRHMVGLDGCGTRGEAASTDVAQMGGARWTLYKEGGGRGNNSKPSWGKGRG